MRSDVGLFLLPEVVSLFSEVQLLSRTSREWKQASQTHRPPLFLNMFEIKDNSTEGWVFFFFISPPGTSSTWKQSHSTDPQPNCLSVCFISFWCLFVWLLTQFLTSFLFLHVICVLLINQFSLALTKFTSGPETRLLSWGLFPLKENTVLQRIN